MSVSGPCAICNSASVEYTCNRCGQLVCEDHYDESTGYCVECAAELGQTENIPESDEMPDGVDTYEF